MPTEQEVVERLTRFYRETDEAIQEQAPVWRPSAPRIGRPSWRTQILATAAVLLLLIVTGLLIHQARLLNSNAPVKSPGPRAQTYQTMVSKDALRIYDAISPSCDTISDAQCPAALVKLTGTVQRLLDDLNSTPPPARLAGATVDLRLHLTAVISDLNAGAVDFQAKNQEKMQSDLTQAAHEWENSFSLVADIAQAHPVPLADYKQKVAQSVAGLLKSVDCSAACRNVVTLNPSTCAADPNCQADAKVFDGDVELTIATLVTVIPPAALSADDVALQRDLSSADLALRQIIAAVAATPLASDQLNQLTTGQNHLTSALDRLREDATRILKASH